MRGVAGWKNVKYITISATIHLIASARTTEGSCFLMFLLQFLLLLLLLQVLSNGMGRSELHEQSVVSDRVSQEE